MSWFGPFRWGVLWKRQVLQENTIIYLALPPGWRRPCLVHTYKTHMFVHSSISHSQTQHTHTAQAEHLSAPTHILAGGTVTRGWGLSSSSKQSVRKECLVAATLETLKQVTLHHWPSTTTRRTPCRGTAIHSSKALSASAEYDVCMLGDAKATPTPTTVPRYTV